MSSLGMTMLNEVHIRFMAHASMRMRTCTHAAKHHMLVSLGKADALCAGRCMLRHVHSCKQKHHIASR
eukprot:361333-Chlamydomonas_euryale.AAC.1